MPKLIVSGTVHELVEEVITVGRAPDNIIVLNDSSVSGRHAELRVSERSYTLRDVGSTNGTQVNGNSTANTLLRHGDRIRFGAVQARFETDVVMSATQPLPVADKAQAKSAALSTRPADFANASPFRARTKERDPGRKWLFILLAVALLALLAAIAAVLTMHAPAR
ncbi:MAG: FHA domain-containing protein [Verrucomicrobia bacterium]|nr:FHA domain-containing protein [Verrucomicrobiota bacterium]